MTDSSFQRWILHASLRDLREILDEHANEDLSDPQQPKLTTKQAAQALRLLTVSECLPAIVDLEGESKEVDEDDWPEAEPEETRPGGGSRWGDLFSEHGYPPKDDDI